MSIFVQNITEGFDYDLQVSRGQFEDICAPDVDPLLEPVEWCLEDCGLAREDVDDIVLVGGAARIPRIRRAMREFFYCRTPQEVLRPDNAGVLGAAAYAELALGRIIGGLPAELDHVELIQTSPWTLPPSDCGVPGTTTPARPDPDRLEDLDTVSQGTTAPRAQAEPSSPSTSAESAGGAEVGGSAGDASNSYNDQQRRDCDETKAKALRDGGANTRTDTSIPFAQGGATSPGHLPTVVSSAANSAPSGMEESWGETSPRQTATPPVAWSPPVAVARSLPSGGTSAASSSAAEKSVGGPRIGRGDMRQRGAVDGCAASAASGRRRHPDPG